MGMYTEFLFQGETKPDLPKDIEVLINYFFNENSAFRFYVPTSKNLPDHPFFKCDRWMLIGHMSSYYFSPFALRQIQKHVREDGGLHVFLLCSIKNYDNEIEQFMNWLDPYMHFYWNHIWYEENEKPIFFNTRI